MSAAAAPSFSYILTFILFSKCVSIVKGEGKQRVVVVVVVVFVVCCWSPPLSAIQIQWAGAGVAAGAAMLTAGYSRRAGAKRFWQLRFSPYLLKSRASNALRTSCRI